MVSWRFLAVCTLSWALLVASEGDVSEEETVETVIDLGAKSTSTEAVIELGAEDFDSTIAEHPVILVEFYAPWCGHCKNLAPEYEKAADVLSAINVPLAKVDATVHTELASRYGVTGYPTLKVFHDGVPYDYEGPRTASGIVQYMNAESSPDWSPPADHVLVLSGDNFTATVESSPLILVEFYAPWCGHCKRLEPEYKKAAGDLQSRGIALAKVDATVETELAQQYGVEGYPTLVMFRQGVQFPYGGPRERQGIVQYMLEQSKPPSSQVTSVKQLTQMLNANNLPVVLLCSDDVPDSYLDLANSGRESPLTFAHTASASVCADIGLEMGSAGIVRPQLYRSEAEPSLVSVDVTNTDWTSLLTAARPLVGIRSQATQEAWYSHHPLLVAYLEIDTTREGVKQFQYWRSRLVKVAQKFPQLVVAMSDETEYESELISVGLSDWGEDVAMVIWASANEKYPMMEDTDFVTFVEDYFAGELKPYVRSQPKPRKDKGPVVTVVGSTFEDVVLDPSKHVMIEFYAPWCGHCKNLEPKYKDLAKKFKKREDVVIAKFDATANDAPAGFDYSGFPTLFLVRAGSNQVVLYEGEREVKAMASFIKKQTKEAKDEL